MSHAPEAFGRALDQLGRTRMTQRMFSNVMHVRLPDGLSEISPNCFTDSYITSIEVPRSVRLIHACAF